MSNCYICGANNWHEELVNQTFEIKGQLILVEKIPAKVCSSCGEIVFSSETAERVRLMLNGNQKPYKSIQIDVFAFSP